MKTWKLAFIIMAASLLIAIPVLAQTDDSTPPPEDEAETTGTVTGQIVNGTDGADVPGNLGIMLHVLDGDFNEKEMIHGQTDVDGRFQFDEVPFLPELIYSVMASYQDVNYFSMPTDVPAGEMTLDLEVPVFEVTTDTSAVQVDGMHIFFQTDQGGLLVGEVYSLSNLGDQTVAGAAALDDGTPVTFRFDLPSDASSVSFPDDRGNRFFLTSGGFADTAPLLPGQRSGQIVVTYILPYTDGLTLNRTAVFPTQQVNILLPPALGLSLEGDNLGDGERQDMGNGTVVDVYTLENLAEGETVSLSLSGDLVVPGIAPATDDVARTTNPKGLAIGGIVLGLAVIGVGVWWSRRPVEEEVEEFPPAFEEIVQQIAQLDAAHDQQEIDDEAYQLQRMDLREQARTVLAQGGD